jgi:hypothetical protein
MLMLCIARSVGTADGLVGVWSTWGEEGTLAKEFFYTVGQALNMALLLDFLFYFLRSKYLRQSKVLLPQ